MDNTMNFKKNVAEKFSCKSPMLFSIPLDVYSDEVEKHRDRESFLKIQKLAKKCEQLREKFYSYAQSHSARMEKTRFLVLRTIEVTNNIRGRRVEE